MIVAAQAVADALGIQGLDVVGVGLQPRFAQRQGAVDGILKFLIVLSCWDSILRGAGRDSNPSPARFRALPNGTFRDREWRARRDCRRRANLGIWPLRRETRPALRGIRGCKNAGIQAPPAGLRRVRPAPRPALVAAPAAAPICATVRFIRGPPRTAFIAAATLRSIPSCFARITGVPRNRSRNSSAESAASSSSGGAGS